MNRKEKEEEALGSSF